MSKQKKEDFHLPAIIYLSIYFLFNFYIIFLIFYINDKICEKTNDDETESIRIGYNSFEIKQIQC